LVGQQGNTQQNVFTIRRTTLWNESQRKRLSCKKKVGYLVVLNVFVDFKGLLIAKQD